MIFALTQSAQWSCRETDEGDMQTEERLSIKKADLIEVLSTLETVVVSLDRIGSCYAELGQEGCDKTTVEFLDQWNIWHKLSRARRILSDYFPTQLGDDDMDELERALQDTPSWQWGCRKPHRERAE